MTKRIQEILAHIALDDTQRPSIRTQARECVEWLKEAERDTQEDAEIWTTLLEGLKDVPLVSPHYERVREFMQRAGQETPIEYTELDADTRILRAKLILKEALETIDALGVTVLQRKGTIPQAVIGDEKAQLIFKITHKLDVEGLIDGLTDMSVVGIAGTMIAMGLPDIPFLRETDRANAEKFEPPRCLNIYCDHTEPMVYHSDIEQWVCHGYHDDMKERFLPKVAGPYRRSDGKWIKPPYHTPPNHTRVAHSLGINLHKEEPK